MTARAILAACLAAVAGATPAAAAFTDAAAHRGAHARAADVFAPRLVAAPSLSGAPRERETLTTAGGSWERQPAELTYAWSRCDPSGTSCAPIAQATASTYRAASADIGSTLRVRVTATNAGGTASATSSAVGPVRRSYAGEVAMDGPSMYLRLDGNRTASAGTSANEYGNTAFATPGALDGNATNQAATFTPSSALVVSESALVNAGTVELWFKGATGVLVGTQSGVPFGSTSGYAPLLYVDTAGVLRAGMFDLSAGSRVISSGTSVTDGAWHHAAVTRSGATLRLFLDGQHAGTVTATGSWSVQSGATLGSGVADGTWWPGTGATQQHWQHFTGQIDEFATYPAVLSQARLQAHIAAAR